LFRIHGLCRRLKHYLEDSHFGSLSSDIYRSGA
jgi:hypothetical protein